MTRIGILGGGQLSVMLAESVLPLGADVAVYDPDPAAPARTRLRDVTTRPWTDHTALAAFAGRCDVVTYEFENIPASAVDTCAATTRVWPRPEVLGTTQDRQREKRFLADAGLPHVPFRSVATRRDLERAASELGYPFVLKSSRGGYDGKGQTLVRSGTELQRLLATAADASPVASGWVLETFIALEAELSCIVARDATGHAVAFPALENIHRDHILDVTLLPARLPATVCTAAQALARRAADALDVVGLLTVEFFLGTPLRSGANAAAPPTLYVNELAPRPHNSGHVTRNACTLSQFDALARVLVGAPLTEPAILGSGGFCMANLLGDLWVAQGGDDLALTAWRHHAAVVDVYLYGKHPALPRRKMGHCITVGADATAAIEAARAFRRDLARTRQPGNDAARVPPAA